jgi:hypothetical protein
VGDCGPVDPDVVVDTERGNPRDPFHELELGRGGVERRPYAERDRERHERDGQRQPPEEPVAAAIGLADEKQQDGAGERKAPRKSQ